MSIRWDYAGLGLLVLLVLGYVFYEVFEDDSVEEVSATNGKKFNVRSDGNETNKQETANYLAKVAQNVDKLVHYMTSEQKPTPEIAARLKKRWNNCTLRETSSKESSVAYTVNKGEEMRICVKSGTKMENMNTTMFVVLHELGHLMSVSYGHNEEFRENFSFIVHLASSLGLYRPEDFYNKPVNYCGTLINTTPCGGGTCAFTSAPKEERLKYGISVEAFGNTRGFLPTFAKF